MRLEIKSAAEFLTNLLRIKSANNRNVYNNRNDKLNLFCETLQVMLCCHYQEHWFPENPFKGSGYRCIRINHKMDPIISKAGSECGLDETALRNLFPDELTMWIDPMEVSYRIGENGSICVLFDGGSACLRPEEGPVSHRVTITLNRRRNDNSPLSTPENSPPNNYTRLPMACKETIRHGRWDLQYAMDPRKINLDHTQYVMS